MDQLESNSEKNGQDHVELPGRKMTMEFLVGLFALVGVLALAYQAVGLGGLEFLSSDKYEIYAEFDNISGLQEGASVEIAGVSIGEVSKIVFKDPEAQVTFKITPDIKIRDDDIASIRTKGIIGDRYVKISRGASDLHVEEGDTMTETESVIDIEDIIGKIVHGLGGDDD